ncbi:hypothetical protein ACE41H_15290 [Paenibacillus enshidis]|uniref:Uncharacterized protein n=1 Tax=Paenibacillus enshidis TaxID=1458439 RepID=A0ABV5AV92_9BACL
MDSRKVAVRHDPFDLSEVQVWQGEKCYADAVPVELRVPVGGSDAPSWGEPVEWQMVVVIDDEHEMIYSCNRTLLLQKYFSTCLRG